MARTAEEWAKYQREYYSKHGDFIRERRKRRYNQIPKSERYAKNRRYQLKTQYGLTVEMFDAIWKRQGGKCANPGCRSVLAKGTAKFAVDHCHKAGHVRGILCTGCNTSIGSLGNSVRRTLGLAKYLSREIIFNGD